VPPPDEGSPDIAWLHIGDSGEGHLFSAGERLPVGVEAFPGRLPNDVVLWVESRSALIAGDTLVDFGQDLEIPVEWLPPAVTREQIAEGLRPAARTASRARARDARRAERPGRARASPLLTPDAFVRDAMRGHAALGAERHPPRRGSCWRPGAKRLADLPLVAERIDDPTEPPAVLLPDR
jgi:glyoxylase-like metal-dependent hydrolase (beta-lactamase superfamily II)